jgi:hypothetical protein
MAKIALILLDLTAKEQAEVLKKYGAKGKVVESDDDDEDETEEDETEDEDETDDDDDAPAARRKKVAKKGKKAAASDDDEEDETEDEDETDEEDETEDDDGPTLAEVVKGFRLYAKKNGMPKAKALLKSFKVKNVNDLDEKMYTKVLAKLKATK